MENLCSDAAGKRPSAASQNSVKRPAGKTYAGPLKISAIQLRDFNGARRRKPLMNRLKSARLRHMESDRQLVGDLMQDALQRYRIQWSPRHAYRPMSVWNEISHHCDLPLIPATKLPRWRVPKPANSPFPIPSASANGKLRPLLEQRHSSLSKQKVSVHGTGLLLRGKKPRRHYS
jgi:hypothetical protein